MATNFRQALDSVSEAPLSADVVLMTLGYLPPASELSSIAYTLGEDGSCPNSIKRVSSAVYALEKDFLVERSPANPRKVLLTERGRRRELQLREQLIRKSARPTAAACVHA